jgi:hypothetical protein
LYLCKKNEICLTIFIGHFAIIQLQRNSKHGTRNKSLTASRKTVSNTQADEYEIHPSDYGGYGYGRSAKPR